MASLGTHNREENRRDDSLGFYASPSSKLALKVDLPPANGHAYSSIVKKKALPKGEGGSIHLILFLVQLGLLLEFLALTGFHCGPGSNSVLIQILNGSRFQ